MKLNDMINVIDGNVFPAEWAEGSHVPPLFMGTLPDCDRFYEYCYLL